LLFVYVCDTDVTSGFASEFTSKLDSLDSRIRIRIREIEYDPISGEDRGRSVDDSIDAFAPDDADTMCAFKRKQPTNAIRSADVASPHIKFMLFSVTY